jgi:hypothetical protein
LGDGELFEDEDENDLAFCHNFLPDSFTRWCISGGLVDCLQIGPVSQQVGLVQHIPDSLRHGLFLLVVFPFFIGHHQIPLHPVFPRQYSRSRRYVDVSHPSCCSTLSLQQIASRSDTERDTSSSLQIRDIWKRCKLDTWRRRRRSPSTCSTVGRHSAIRPHGRCRSIAGSRTRAIPVVEYGCWWRRLTRS